MKKQADNIGKFGLMKPLRNMRRVRGRVDFSTAELEQWQAKRIYRDMQAFIPARYPEQRNIVLSTVFLTLGAAYAARAGVDGSEVVQFVAEEQEKCV
jgi:hypothetical protein